jgi:hypothetical protein
MTALNHRDSGGQFAAPVRHLQTYTIHVHAFTGRYMVADDRQAGRLVGFGFATIDAAVKAYARQDFERTGLR